MARRVGRSEQTMRVAMAYDDRTTKISQFTCLDIYHFHAEQQHQIYAGTVRKLKISQRGINGYNEMRFC